MKQIKTCVYLAVLSGLFGIQSIQSGATSTQESVQAAAPLTVRIEAPKTRLLTMKVMVLGSEDAVNKEVFDAFCRAVRYTDQFEIDVAYVSEKPRKKEIFALKDAGYNSVLLVDCNDKEGAFDWRLYETKKAKMQKGFRVPKEGKLARGWGYAVADSFLGTVINSKPFALSKLTYCQEGPKGKSIVWVADFDGTHAQKLIESDRQIVASSWNRDPENPLVLYSQYTALNIWLKSCSLSRKETVAASFEGLNMQPAFSPDGKEVVLCLSRDGSSQLYHYGFNDDLRKVGYTRLTYNSGNNFAPAFLDNGDLVFCSDFELGKPQIYYLNRQEDSIERLTKGTSSVSPNYSSVKNMIAYSKLKDGIMQLHTYDLEEKKEKQITFDAGHKQDCSWFPCGDYIGYTLHEPGKGKRIVSHSLLTGKKKYITEPNKTCSYPSWSTVYRSLPVVT